MAAITRSKPVEQWTCTICDRSMSASAMDAHLQGKPHLRTVLGRWYCDACRFSVENADKAAHLAGKRHARLAQEWHCDICDMAILLFKKKLHLAGKRHVRLAQEWHCNVCDISMSLFKRESHLAGRQHAAKPPSKAKSSSNFPKPIYGSSKSTTSLLHWGEIFGIAITVREQAPQKRARADTKPVLQQKWRCKVCLCSMDLCCKESHLSGRPHAAAATGLPARPRPRPVPGKQHPEMKCKACDFSVLEVNFESHLRGYRHTRSLQLRRKPSALAPPSAKWVPTHPSWRCQPCGRSMPETEKEAHLKGTAHRKRKLSFEYALVPNDVVSLIL